uniref:G_PROTEIN_RECEP_F1_2 domain-containing protein n=1 Tax=Haemonchus contortus TaxID=6289 RepID=A0A7I5EA20_HAECO
GSSWLRKPIAASNNASCNFESLPHWESVYFVERKLIHYMSTVWNSEVHLYADSWFTIDGRPVIRFSGRNIVEFIFLCISAAGIPLTLLTIFVISTETPIQLKKYQWILLNLLVTVFITDITICFLFDPLPVFPEIACYSESWFANLFKDANFVLFSISIILLQFSFCGTLVAFIHRLNALQPLPGKLESLLLCNTHYITAAIYIFGNIPIIYVLISSYKLLEEMEAVVERKPQLKFLNGYRSYLATEENDPKFAQFEVIWLTH